MKIYGIKIVAPHSGECSRSKVITEMIADMQNHHHERVTRANLKEICENSIFTHFRMQDVNYQIFGTFEAVPCEEENYFEGCDEYEPTFSK